MKNTFYFPAHMETLHLGGDGQKAGNNLRVIQLIKQLDRKARSAAPKEQSLLADLNKCNSSG